MDSRPLQILPPITQSKIIPENKPTDSIPQRLSALESKADHLEITSSKLIEIVFQLKNTIENVIKGANSKDSSSSKQLETRIVQVEKMLQSPRQSKSRGIDLQDAGLNQISTQLMTISSEIGAVQGDRNRLENSIMKLTEEMYQLKNQFVIQGDLLTSMSSQYTSKTKRLREEYINNLDSVTDRMMHTQEAARHLTSWFSVQDEMKENLTEMKHELKKIKMQVEEQIHAFTNNEANLAFRISELAQLLNDEKRTREVEVRRVDLMYEDTIHKYDSTRMVLENHLSGLLSESASKMMDRETATRISLTQKIAEFEKMLLQEASVRSNREKEINARINDVLERSSEYQKESLEEFRQSGQQYHLKMNAALKQIESGLRLIEQSSEEKLRQYHQVVSAEIICRKKLQDSIASEIVIVEEKIRAATAAMQLAISGLANQIQSKSDSEELRHSLDRRICDFQLYMSRNFADIDAQLQQMTGRMTGINLAVETRIAQATSDLTCEMRETLSSVISWQANSTAHLKEMQAVRVNVMQELAKMQLTLNHIESEIPSQMTMETDERIQAIGDIRHQMESLKIAMNSQPAIKELDVDKIHESIRKLAETLQSMKSTMGMKIQSEQTMRLSQIKDLQAEMRYIEEQFLMKTMQESSPTKTNKYIIKPPEEKQASIEWHASPMAFLTLNQWSIYSIWKWIRIKEKLLDWKIRAKKNKGKNKTKPKSDQNQTSKPRCIIG